jgi:hypothetical protein
LSTRFSRLGLVGNSPDPGLFLAAELWDIFGEEFTTIDEIHENTRQKIRSDSKDDLPF